MRKGGQPACLSYKRQQFHVPCHAAQLKLRNIEFKSFLARYEGSEGKSIFWLDYTGLKYGCFEAFMALLEKVSPNSLIKITLRCEPSDYLDKNEAEASRKRQDFQKQFQAVLPRPFDEPPATFASFARLLQDMAKASTAAEKSRNYALTWKSGASAPRKWSKDQGAL